jgi:hypothetical protein
MEVLVDGGVGVKLGIACGVLVVLGGLTGCGNGEVTVHSQSAQQIALRAPAHCNSDYMTLVTASEAFRADNGVFPSGQSALVDAGLLYKASDDFNLTNMGTEYLLTGIGDCSGFEPG